MHESTLPTATACKQTRRQSGQRACAQPCDCALAPCPYQISTQHTPSSTYIVARLMARLNEAPVPTESVDARKSSCIPPSLSPTLTCRSKAPLRATEPRTRKVCASTSSSLESSLLTGCLSETTRPNVCASAPSSAKSHACSPRTSIFVKTLSTSRPNCPNLAPTSTTLHSSQLRTNCRPNCSILATSFPNSVASNKLTPLRRKTNSPILPHGVPKSPLPFCLVKPRGWMALLKKRHLQVAPCSMFRHNPRASTTS
jgi:hypothetical protein